MMTCKTDSSSRETCKHGYGMYFVQLLVKQVAAVFLHIRYHKGGPAIQADTCPMQQNMCKASPCTKTVITGSLHFTILMLWVFLFRCWTSLDFYELPLHHQTGKLGF